MADAETLEEIAHPEYWDARYSRQEEPPYEWFGSYSTLEPFFERYIPPAPSSSDPQLPTRPLLLHLGCGNSTLPIDLLSYNYSQICIDFSKVVIDKMAARYKGIEDLDWRIMDVRDMLGIANASIDVAIDKGTLDAMIHGSPWDPPEEVRSSTSRYINEVVRVLKPGGVFLYITYRQPHFMKAMLEREEWEVGVEVLSGGQGTFDYSGFVIRKSCGGDTPS